MQFTKAFYACSYQLSYFTLNETNFGFVFTFFYFKLLNYMSILITIFFCQWFVWNLLTIMCMFAQAFFVVLYTVQYYINIWQIYVFIIKNAVDSLERIFECF